MVGSGGEIFSATSVATQARWAAAVGEVNRGAIGCDWSVSDTVVVGGVAAVLFGGRDGSAAVVACQGRLGPAPAGGAGPAGVWRRRPGRPVAGSR
jgi:hypothetical protein